VVNTEAIDQIASNTLNALMTKRCNLLATRRLMKNKAEPFAAAIARM
jgi:hypothetical protein